MWASTMTRPDMASAIRQVAKFCDNLGQTQRTAVVMILQYVLQTINKDIGLTYWGSLDGGLNLPAFEGADHATCLNNRRSILNRAIFLAGADISWFSGKQQATAISASESEYVAITEMVKKYIFCQQVQLFIIPKMEQHYIMISEDKEGDIKLANHPINNQQKKNEAHRREASHHRGRGGEG